MNCYLGMFKTVCEYGLSELCYLSVSQTVCEYGLSELCYLSVSQTVCRQFGEFCHLSVCETVWIQFDEFVYQCVSQCGYSLLNCVLCAVFDPPLPHSPHISYIPQVPKDKLNFDQVSCCFLYLVYHKSSKTCQTLVMAHMQEEQIASLIVFIF